MRRPFARRPLAAVATLAMATTIGVTAISMSAAQAATGGVTGYATQNGGTTGGAGGQTVRATTGTAIHTALCSRASSSTPIIIQVSGTINHGNTTQGVGRSCNTAADVIELKEISNVTIIGVGGGAVFDQLGIHIRDSSNIIIQNVTVRNVKKSGSPISNGGDAIGMESTVRNVWVDHVTLEASGGESEGYDGLFDMKDNTQYVTLSYSILRNSGRGGLIGSSESDRSNGFITFHHNLYENIDSRTPAAARRHRAHLQQLLREPQRVRHQLPGRRQGQGGQQLLQELQGRPRHLLHRPRPATWQVSGNIFDNVTWSAPAARTTRPARTCCPPPPSASRTPTRLDGASCVPTVVGQTAGANKGLQVSNGSCTPTDADRRPPTPTPTPDRRPPTTTPDADRPRPTADADQPSGTNLSIGAGCRRLQQGQRDELRQRAATAT